jgi:hypothetical protein
MDELTQRALTRAIAAFAIVLLAGGAIVLTVHRLQGAGKTFAPSQTPSPTTTVSPAPDQPDAWLAWVPGGIPSGFGEQITAVPAVDTTTTETADVAWLVGSTDAEGSIVDQPPDPYRIPIDVTGVEPAFASFLPLPERTEVTDLGDGEGILSQSAAALRGLGPDATMTFEGQTTITITATLPDVMMGGFELLVTRATGETIGVTHDRYVLFTVKEGAERDPVTLSARFEPYLPPATPYDAVEVRAPFTTRYLRPNDRELPPVLLKQRFGEFAADPEPNGDLTVDPSWVAAHVESRTLPVLGSITCHQKALNLLEDAMRELETEGRADQVQDVGDCDDANVDPTDPEGQLTAIDFGAAIELNRNANPPGEPPTEETQPPELVNLLFRSGFGWGGRDAWPQGALFRYRHPVRPTD